MAFEVDQGLDLASPRHEIVGSDRGDVKFIMEYCDVSGKGLGVATEVDDLIGRS